MTVAMAGEDPMPMSAALKLAPRANCDPAAEQDEGGACRHVHEVTEPGREPDAREPDNEPDSEGGPDMAEAGLEGGSRRLGSRPPSLPGEERNGRPMIGNGRVQDADDQNGHHEKETRGQTCVRAPASEVFRQGFEFAQRLPRGDLALRGGVAEAMLHVVLDQRPLGRMDDALHGLHLLREFEAGALVLEHLQDGGELAMRLLQAVDDFRVRSVFHATPYPLGGRGSSVTPFRAFSATPALGDAHWPARCRRKTCGSSPTVRRRARRTHRS